jgi:hypothetical protein
MRAIDGRARNFESAARERLENPDREYPGDWGRTVAERTPPGSRLAVKVVYNRGLENEHIVVSVMRGRPGR